MTTEAIVACVVVAAIVGAGPFAILYLVRHPWMRRAVLYPPILAWLAHTLHPTVAIGIVIGWLRYLTYQHQVREEFERAKEERERPDALQ